MEGPKKIFIQKREGLLRRDPMRKQRYSVRPGEVGKSWPSARYMFRKGKSAIEDDPKKSWSWTETEARVA